MFAIRRAVLPSLFLLLTMSAGQAAAPDSATLRSATAKLFPIGGGISDRFPRFTVCG